MEKWAKFFFVYGMIYRFLFLIAYIVLILITFISILPITIMPLVINGSFSWGDEFGRIVERARRRIIYNVGFPPDTKSFW